MENRIIEFRAAGDNVIEGVAIRFGDVAELPWGNEIIESAVLADEVMANRQHDRSIPLGIHPGNLSLTLTTRSLDFSLSLPDTQDGRDTYTLAKAGILRSASLEFLPMRETMREGTRVLQQVEVHGVAIVDRGAYPDSEIQARAAHFKAIRETVTGRRNVYGLAAKVAAGAP